jgi:hypothetical protein
MPIARLLENHAFSPDDTRLVVAAFEATLRELRLIGQKEFVMQIVAEKMVELALRGERDPVRLRERTIVAVIGPDAA